MFQKICHTVTWLNQEKIVWIREHIVSLDTYCFKVEGTLEDDGEIYYFRGSHKRECFNEQKFFRQFHLFEKN